jgi:hypothetical protein
MEIRVNTRTGMEIEGVGVVRFGMPVAEMLSLLGEPESVFGGRHEFRRIGCFVDVKSAGADRAEVVDAIEFWNDREANVASVKLFDVEVLREPGVWVKALLESRNAAAAVDSWYVNLDVFVSGGNPRYAYEEIDRNRTEGTFVEVQDVLLEELQKARVLTSFGFGRANYCSDGLAELEAMMKS